MTLPPDVDAWLLPQERFDVLRAHAARRAGKALADLSYANAWDGPSEVVIGAIRRALDAHGDLDFQYTPYGGATVPRRLVATRLAESHGGRWHYEDVVLTPGAMAALTVTLRAVRRDGDENEVVIVTPAWLDTPTYVAAQGMRPVLVPVDAASLRPDVGAIAAALGPATRAVVITQPHNPTGLLWRRAELEALAAALRATPAPPLLVSDECHRDFLFTDTPWVSPVAVYDRTVVVYSFGKAWRAQGQRIGYVAVPPAFPEGRAFARDLVRWCRALGVATPTVVMQRSLADLAAARPSLEPFATRRSRALADLARSGYDVPVSDASFFLYPRVPPGMSGFALAERLADDGVVVLPAELFHHTGHVRIALTATDAMLARALEAFARAGGAVR